VALPASDAEEEPQKLPTELPDRVILDVTVTDWVASCDAGTVITGDTLIVRLCVPQGEAVVERAAVALPASDAEEEPQKLPTELPERVILVVTVPDWLGTLEGGTVTTGDTLVVRLRVPQGEAVAERAAVVVPGSVTDTDPVRVTVTEAVGHPELCRDVVGVIDRVGVAVLATVITVRVTEIVTVEEEAVE
jgi:hypothetical protein